MLFHGLRSDVSRDVVTAIDVVDEDIAGGMLAVDVREGVSADIRHACAAEHIVQVALIDRDGGVAVHVAQVAAAIDVAANAYLGLRPHRP